MKNYKNRRTGAVIAVGDNTDITGTGWELVKPAKTPAEDKAPAEAPKKAPAKKKK